MNLTKYITDLTDEHLQLLTAAFTMAENAGNIHLKYFRKAGLEQSTKLTKRQKHLYWTSYTDISLRMA